MYTALSLVLLGFLLSGTYEAYSEAEILELESSKQSDACLVQFQQKKCELDNITGECNTLLTCMKKKPLEMSTFAFIFLVLGNYNWIIENSM